jgi:hypothetical protein
MKVFIAHAKTENKDVLLKLKHTIQVLLQARLACDVECVLGLEDWERTFEKSYSRKWGDWIDSISSRKDTTSGKKIYDLIVLVAGDGVVGKATGEMYLRAISNGVKCTYFDSTLHVFRRITHLEQIPGKPSWSQFYVVHTEAVK